MLDISYAGSPLVGEHLGSVRAPSGPAPGDRFPGRIHLTGRHHHLLFGAHPPPDVFQHRWRGLVAIEPGTDVDPARTGVSFDGALLIRPDGFIGYRIAEMDEGSIAALDAHLASYLTPNRT